MRPRKLFAIVMLVALLGSDFGLALSPALGQTSTTGDGQPLMPSLTTGDGTYGKVLPGPSTTAPYIGAPQQKQQQQLQQMLQQSQPPMAQRPVGPAGSNVCQPGGGTRSYQTYSIPRTRTVEPLPMQQPPAGTVTQVTVSQSAPGVPAQVNQQSAADAARLQSGGLAPAAPEVDELSRIEAGFNLDPIRVQQIAGLQQVQQLQLQQPCFQQQAQLQQSQLQQPQLQQVQLQQPQLQQGQLQQPQLQQQPQQQQQFQQAQQRQLTQDQAYLGPFGTPLRQYGYSMFATNVSTFAPVDDIPVGPDYVLGPGDDLTITVWGAVDSTLLRTVDRNGRIVLPKVGDLRIWGLTFAQADRLIRDELGRYFRGFQTSVTMGRLRTVSVHVVGEVCQPGVYTLSSLSTATNALYSAGGPTKLGAPPRERPPPGKREGREPGPLA